MALPSAAHIDGAERVLTAPALAFVEDLTRRFRPRIDELLARRRVVQERHTKGDGPDFPSDTADIRRADWKVGSIPSDLQDRRVEITGPVDRKMIINALNSGASVFMADFEDATRHNIRVGIQYLEAWLGGQSAVPIYNLMEDAATAEISRTQIWQWLAHRAALDDGRTVTQPMVEQFVAEELARVREEVGAKRFERGRFDQARSLFVQVATSGELQEFLTIPAYETLVNTS
jgi:malate synthase